MIKLLVSTKIMGVAEEGMILAIPCPRRGKRPFASTRIHPSEQQHRIVMMITIQYPI